MEIYAVKLPNGTLAPADQPSADEMRKLKIGQPVRIKITRQRNYEFLKKYFALMTYAFEVWEPGETYAEKNFDRFRKDITILSGFYEQHVRVNGDIRVEARSISFIKMDAVDFEILYAKTIDVLIKYVLRNHTSDQVREIVEELQGYE